VLGLLSLLIEGYSLLVFATVLVSWFGGSDDNPVVQFLHRATEPALGPIRRVLPPLGGLDLSPLVLLVLLQILKSMLWRL